MGRITLTSGPGYIRLCILAAITVPAMYGLMILALKWMVIGGQWLEINGLTP